MENMQKHTVLSVRMIRGQLALHYLSQLSDEEMVALLGAARATIVRNVLKQLEFGTYGIAPKTDAGSS